MFKFIHVTDTHFGLETHGVDNPKTGLNTRTEDGLQAFDQLVDYAIANDIKYVIHSGDVFNTKTVSQTVVNAFYERCKRLNLPMYILQGNHDASKYLMRKNGLDLAETLDLELIHVTRGGEYVNTPHMQIVSTSYWNSAEEADAEIKELAKKVDWKRPAILVVHMQIQYADFPGSFKHDLPFIPLATLTSHPWTYVACGHIHKPQELNANPPVYYGGSLVRCSAAEEFDQKGFLVISVPDKGEKTFTHVERVEVDCLSFWTFRGTMSQLIEQYEEKDYSKFIVRLILDDTVEPIDDAFVKDKFGASFKCIVSTEALEKDTTKVKTASGISMETYLDSYFADDTDKEDLIKLVAELRNLDEAAACD